MERFILLLILAPFHAELPNFRSSDGRMVKKNNTNLRSFSEALIRRQIAKFNRFQRSLGEEAPLIGNHGNTNLSLSRRLDLLPASTRMYRNANMNRILLPIFDLTANFYPIIRDPRRTSLYVMTFVVRDVMSGGSSTAGVIPALQMAVDDINEREDILPGYEMVLDIRDSKCDPGYAVYNLIESLNVDPVKLMIIGGGCSGSTAPVAKTIPYYGLNQIAYSATSPELANKGEYPTLFRTATSDLAMNRPIVSICLQYNWYHVATIHVHEYQSLFSETINQLHLYFEMYNITLVAAESFLDSPKESLANMQRKRARIIIFYGYEDAAARVFCEAYLAGMYGVLYQWIVPGQYNPGWWDYYSNTTDCTAGEILEALNFSITVTDIKGDISGEETISGQTYDEYLERYLGWPTTAKHGINDYHPNAYDAVWAAALALEQTRQILDHLGMPVPIELANGTVTYRAKMLEDFKYGADPNMSALIWWSLNTSHFHGVSGPVSFLLGERTPCMELSQIRGEAEVSFARYTEETDQLIYTDDIKWHGSEAPLDWVTYSSVVSYKNKILVFCCVIISSVGVIIAIGFLVFNVKNKGHIHIKMSSPKLNNVIVLGCILSYLSVICLGPDSQTVGESAMIIFCGLRPWILTIAFTLSFGAMFAKTWRVHSIFTRLSKSSKPVHDHHLLMWVGFLFLLDVSILTLWMIIDPLELHYNRVSFQETMSTIILYISEDCVCDYLWYWAATLLLLKGALLLFGCFLAYETRKVSVPSLNDSRYIGFCVYNVVVMCLVGVTVSLALTEKETLTYAFQAFCILFCATSILCLLFIPKILYVRKHPEETVLNRRSGYAGDVAGGNSPSSTFKFSMKSVYKSSDTLCSMCTVKSLGNIATPTDPPPPMAIDTCLIEKRMELLMLKQKYHSLEETVHALESIPPKAAVTSDGRTQTSAMERQLTDTFWEATWDMARECGGGDHAPVSPTPSSSYPKRKKSRQEEDTHSVMGVTWDLDLEEHM